MVSNSTSLANSGLPTATNTGSTQKPKGNAHADCGGTQLNGKGIDKEIVSNLYKVDKRYRIRRERKMKEVSEHQKVTANDTEIIRAMAQSVYFADGAYFHDKAMEWREAYEHICDQEAFDLLQDELGKLFNQK